MRSYPEGFEAIVEKAYKLEKGTDLPYSTNTVSDLGGDSLREFELLMDVEEEYGIEIPDKDLPEIYQNDATGPKGIILGKLADYIERKCGGKSQKPAPQPVQRTLF